MKQDRSLARANIDLLKLDFRLHCIYPSWWSLTSQSSAAQFIELSLRGPIISRAVESLSLNTLVWESKRAIGAMVFCVLQWTVNKHLVYDCFAQKVQVIIFHTSFLIRYVWNIWCDTLKKKPFMGYVLKCIMPADHRNTRKFQEILSAIWMTSFDHKRIWKPPTHLVSWAWNVHALIYANTAIWEWPWTNPVWSLREPHWLSRGWTWHCGTEYKPIDRNITETQYMLIFVI